MLLSSAWWEDFPTPSTRHLAPSSTAALQSDAYSGISKERLCFSSIQQYLNIIRLLQLESGYDNPLADNWMLKSVLQGIKRVKGNSVAHKEPITPDIGISPPLKAVRSPSISFLGSMSDFILWIVS